ncbi:MAG: MFS transporter [Sulfurospirillaceae bacterium]|nr:MFS transporter [Sulfurospirillaceae bacterium]
MISKKQILIMSAAAGVNAANIYYSQPILNNIALNLNLSHGQVGNLPVFTQVGYGLGLFFLTPLGDMIDRKKLIVFLQISLVFTLFGMTIIDNINSLYILSLMTGLFAVAPQVIIPMAVSMSPNTKGKVVGTIFSGLLIGILIARTFSGYMAHWFSWHTVYGLSALFVFLCIVLVQKTLPNIEPNYSSSYISLLRSTFVQMKRFALLRKVSLLGVFSFGIFSSFWTTLTFRLSEGPFHYSSGTIGLFGILAVGGALLAPKLGKLSDRVNPQLTKFLAVFTIIISILMIRWFDTYVLAFVLATILLDIGVQAIQINNFAQIYTLDEEAHSRINTAYMTSMFLGGSIGTFIGVKCWEFGGWNFVTIQLLSWSLIALIIVSSSYKSIKKT